MSETPKVKYLCSYCHEKEFDKKAKSVGLKDADCCSSCHHYWHDYEGEGKCELHFIESAWTEICDYFKTRSSSKMESMKGLFNGFKGQR